MKGCTFVLAIVFVSIVGCATAPIGPGNQPAEIPPRLQLGSDGVKTWDRPNAFGPVPSELAAVGSKMCGKEMKATGYHPKAQDVNGATFSEGGWFCVPNK